MTDPGRWSEYVERVGSTFPPFGGRVLFRGNSGVALNGAAPADRIVIVEFPNVESARRWHDSPHYQALIALRDSAAEVVLSVYQGAR